MESPKLLRVYAAFDLGCGTPTTGLIRTHPHDSAPCSEQEDPPAAWPDRLCLPAHRTSAGRHCGRYLGGKSVIVVRNYSFSRFFTWPTRIHDARPDLNASRRNRITPIRVNTHIIPNSHAVCAAGAVIPSCRHAVILLRLRERSRRRENALQGPRRTAWTGRSSARKRLP